MKLLGYLRFTPVANQLSSWLIYFYKDGKHSQRWDWSSCNLQRKGELTPVPQESLCMSYFYRVFNSAVAGINSTQT